MRREDLLYLDDVEKRADFGGSLFSLRVEDWPSLLSRHWGGV